MKKFPKIMGILNVTPDSFSDGGDYFNEEKAIEQGLKMLEDGADIIDIGGESTRPGAADVSEDEEISRTLPVIKGLLKEKPGLEISIDTTKYNVAKAALGAGATIVNDISGLENDKRLAKLAAERDAALIVMHMQGTPRTMQENPYYTNVVEEIFNLLVEKIFYARKKGVKTIIADVGIGFGKTLEHNLELLRNIDTFRELKVPLLLGISRKSFIDKVLNINAPKERDLPTALIHAMLPGFGGDILRVHNVKMLSMLKKLYSDIYQID